MFSTIRPPGIGKTMETVNKISLLPRGEGMDARTGRAQRKLLY